MIIAHEDDGTSTRVVAQDPDDPEIGQIEMVFTDDPIELRQWIITDANGYETTVILGDMQDGGVEMSEHRLRKQMEECLTTAKEQVMQE